ncbi:MAG: pyridoxamine 5'-phosphate oxidase family protein [Candidatus Saccharimonadales bacterium]
MAHLAHSKTRKKTDELSDRQRRIYDFLHAHPVGVLSSVSANGEPHGVVIYFDIDKKFNVSILTKSETRKYENLKHYNRIMLTVFESHTQTTAQITGEAIEIVGNHEINKVASAILSVSLRVSDQGAPSILKLEAGHYVAFKIKPSQIRMAVYARPDSGDYVDLFDTIESFELRTV